MAIRTRYARALSVLVAMVATGCSRPQPGSSAVPEVTHQLAIAGTDNRGVSLDADGSRVVATWAATVDGRPNIYAAVSHDAGLTFGSPVRVNDVDGQARISGERPPRVSVGRDIAVVWDARAAEGSVVRLARSTDGGRQFQPATTVHETGRTGPRGWVSVARSENDAIHLSWLDGRHAMASAPPHAGAASTHSHSTPLRQDLVHARIDPDGRRDERLVQTFVCFCCKTSTATGQGQDVYVAWRHVYPVNLRDIALARSTDGGVTFGTPVRVSEDGWVIDGCPEDGPSIAVDAEGMVHVAWATLVTEGGSTAKAVFYSFSADGGQTFAPRTRLDDPADAGVAAHPQIAMADSRVVAVWDERVGDRTRIHLREVASVQPNGWAPVLGPLRTLTSDGTGTYPSVTAVADAVLVAWTAHSDGRSSIHARRIASHGATHPAR